ncbi:MAG TPA: HIRAN domain-containing protein [Armatimonadota bacterium]|nr:HIRAN domain-containing protein [Armatimonadota bacterium]
MTGFFTKIVGVSHRNADGSSRQEAISECIPGESLVFAKEKGNPHDPNAIRVLRANRQQLGYLKRELASEVGPRMDDGCRYEVSVAEVTGGSPGKPTLGLNILVRGPIAPGQAEFLGREKASEPSGCLTIGIFIIGAVVGALTLL